MQMRRVKESNGGGENSKRIVMPRKRFRTDSFHKTLIKQLNDKNDIVIYFLFFLNKF